MDQKQIEITDFIPIGYENRVSREYLAKHTRLCDRDVRHQIELSDKPIVSADGGYFIPGNSAKDRQEAEYYVRKEQSRVRAIQCKLRKFKDYK